MSAVTDQEVVLASLRQVGSIIAEHLETTTRDADKVIAQLVAVIARIAWAIMAKGGFYRTPELAAAT